jgi:hypothetical protein
MMILCLGDSWCRGWGIDHESLTWPYLLGSMTQHDILVKAEHGATNWDITSWAQELIPQHQPDVVLIGWSGISRRPFGSLSYSADEVSDERAKFFASQTVKSLQNTWQLQRTLVRAQAIKHPTLIYQWSVFGDHTGQEPLVSCLEYLAGHRFKYQLPIFEFDFLHESNHVTQQFAHRCFDSSWIKACVERESLRLESQDNFLPCGHPSEQGHKVWATYLGCRLESMVCSRPAKF